MNGKMKPKSARLDVKKERQMKVETMHPEITTYINLQVNISSTSLSQEELLFHKINKQPIYGQEI